MDNKEKNAFESLCEQASKEKWCWNYPCSTCANMEFRYGFLELAKGKHPSDEDWILNRDDIISRRVYKFPYNYPFEFPLEVRESVLNICLESDLAVINELCSFPEWLGYLGLILVYMNSWKEPSKLYGKVSSHWAKQLQKMIPESSTVYKSLGTIASNEEYGLDFSILNACERALNGKEAEETKQREEIKKYNESIAYDSLVEIVNNPGHPYSSDVAIYARQEDVDMLNDAQYEKLCQMYASLSINANNPWAKFKEKFLNGR
jgi:hypothetical protein